MKTTVIILAIVLGLILLSQIYFNMAKTETQPYQVIKIEKEFEVRLYPPVMLATISMKVNTYKELSSAGFKKLASYIFGGNETNQNIAMTTPVHMDINDSLSSVSFVMPATYNEGNLPKPNDTKIDIKTTEEEYVAAIQFGGFASDETLKEQVKKLESALQSKGINYFGNFRFLGYNAPYQFLGRKNEIIVQVHWDSE